MDIDLTHPEIMTIEQLQKHLSKFFSTEMPADKYELVKLFYQYISPLPQRKFRSNRWGTSLTMSQTCIGKEKRPSSPCPQEIDAHGKRRSKSPSQFVIKINEFNHESPGEKHESDRGIYTINRQKSANKSAPPIKLKRPVSSTTADDHLKQMKLDEDTS